LFIGRGAERDAAPEALLEVDFGNKKNAPSLGVHHLEQSPEALDKEVISQT